MLLAIKVSNYLFENSDIKVMQWSAQATNLNPIEHLLKFYSSRLR